MSQAYVSTVVKRLKKRLHDKDVPENETRTKLYKDIIDTAVSQFYAQLQRGEVQVNSVVDLERLVKMGMLLMDKPTERIEHTTDIEEEELNEVVNSESFKQLKDLLYQQMNKRNETEQK
jgi:hypothetical protein